MPSLILISLYLIVCLIILGLTESISDSHYGWLERFGFWGYAIFPVVMLTWATLVILECPQLAWAGFGIYYVAIFCMFYRTIFVDMFYDESIPNMEYDPDDIIRSIYI